MNKLIQREILDIKKESSLVHIGGIYPFYKIWGYYLNNNSIKNYALKSIEIESSWVDAPNPKKNSYI